MHNCPLPQAKAHPAIVHAEPAGDESDFLASNASDCHDADAEVSEEERESGCLKESDGGGCCIRGRGDLGSAACRDELKQNPAAAILQQPRGKHGKQKKLKSKYRHQDEHERELILQVC